jgi:hypothetical protein
MASERRSQEGMIEKCNAINELSTSMRASVEESADCSLQEE